ncbi:PAS domain S-box-containing protein [Pseudomonas reinekei]|uniref:histidine kinase n=1 Tax=Pseudomonas reinekei TaxID=395598 RepID=A0A1H0UIY9_PSERE|nr:PAS domain-containing sensor histidine kinase [Pseudomonas reinekei]SDP66131.1 PAS domain S-box-containing protein [Pseudomonas reinekei]
MKISIESTVPVDSPKRPAPHTHLQRFGAATLAGVIFIIDTLTSIHIAIAVLYVAVILMSVNLFSRKGVISVSLSCCGLTLAAFFISHGGDFNSASFARCLVSLSAIGITTLLALKNKAANDELQEQVRMLAQTHDAIIVRDMNGIITTWSPGAEALYGWSREQAIGQDFRTLLRPQLKLTWEQVMHALVETGRWEGEVVEHRCDGTPVTVVSRCSLSRDESNRPKAILATHNDISEQKKAINALRRSEAFLAGAQRLSQTGSIGLKIPGGEMYWSDEARRIFEFGGDEEPLLSSVLKKTHPDDLDLVRLSIKHAYQKEPHIKVEYRLLMADGRIKHVQMLAHPVQDAGGNFEYIGALMDVTEAKMSEEALHRSQTELAHVTRITTLGELAASIAHEVNQPLAAVTTNGTAGLRWLNRDNPNIDEVRSAMERMMSETHRASEVIRRIRAMSRKTDPQSVPVDLMEVIEESLALVDREVRRNKIVLDHQYDTEAAEIMGDRVQLQQVIINLIMNGVQAMSNTKGKPRTLHVCLKRSDAGELCVDIKDNGPGISPLSLPKLFNAFYTTKPDGMGMGLSICRSIIEAHGGRIWATSQDGEGAAFHLTFPDSNEEPA